MKEHHSYFDENDRSVTVWKEDNEENNKRT